MPHNGVIISTNMVDWNPWASTCLWPLRDVVSMYDCDRYLTMEKDVYFKQILLLHISSEEAMGAGSSAWPWRSLVVIYSISATCQIDPTPDSCPRDHSVPYFTALDLESCNSPSLIHILCNNIRIKSRLSTSKRPSFSRVLKAQWIRPRRKLFRFRSRILEALHWL